MRISHFRVRVVAILLAVFTAATAQAQTVSVLYNFGSHSGDPLNPQYEGIIAQGRDGHLYSTTRLGGTGAGEAFGMTPSGTLTSLYNFDGVHGAQPASGLTLGTDGNYYGTVIRGKVFRISPNGTYKTLHSMTASDGASPYAPPIQGSDGNLYGTTSQGGNLTLCLDQGCGTIYKIIPSGKFTVLHQFDGTDGQAPLAPLVQATSGTFYGTTSKGASGSGNVFKITQTGKYTVLYNFDGAHGAGPMGALVQGSDGNFYGTAAGGGSSNAGVVFKITPSGKLTVLHNLNGGSDGIEPVGGLAQATDGNFYGTTAAGTIFRVTTKGSFSVLYTFAAPGAIIETALVQHTNGILYGDTYTGGSGTGCNTDGCGMFYSLNLGLGPFVNLLSTSGKIGKTVEILGQGFTGTSAVAFNGTSASFQVVSDTYLTATVPGGATTGFVTVTTPGGILTSNKEFRVRTQAR
jgi:uncharacterized repeat protein (TIGR03803 family)